MSDTLHTFCLAQYGSFHRLWDIRHAYLLCLFLACLGCWREKKRAERIVRLPLDHFLTGAKYTVLKS